jgi:hypothetical protein
MSKKEIQHALAQAALEQLGIIKEIAKYVDEMSEEAYNKKDVNLAQRAEDMSKMVKKLAKGTYSTYKRPEGGFSSDRKAA